MLRFIFGASGAGKSYRLYREIIRRSEEEPERNFLILVPDQFTMQTQRDIVRMHPKKGIMNIDALSFSRLIHRVFDETGRPEESALDDLGKSLILRHVAEEMKDTLPVIGTGMRKAGYVDEVKSTISELMQYDISPDDMQTMIDACAKRPALQAKLTDLQRLYRGFQDYAAKKYLTAEETLVLCAERISQSALFRDALVALDGFTGFTPVQYRVLRAIYKTAKELVVTITISPEALLSDQTESSLFALSKKTVRDLTNAVYRAEKETDPQYTPEYAAWEEAMKRESKDTVIDEVPVFRYKDNPVLSHLEQHLLRDVPVAYGKETDAVRLVVCSTAAEEVRQTFRRIRMMLRADETLQFRDFAIVSAQPEQYEDLIARAAADFEINVYQDRTESIRLNPFIEYLRSILDIIRTNFSAQSVFHYLRSGMTDEEMCDVDVLELYVRAFDLRGQKAWSEKFVRQLPDGIRREDEEALAMTQRQESVRARMMERLSPLLKAVSEKGTVKTCTDALMEMAKADGVEEKLLRGAEDFAAQGDLAAAEEYRQIMGKVIQLFDAVCALLGDETMRIGEYADVLEAGFSEISLGTIPRDIDRVIVGDLTRTRISHTKHLFLIGASDTAIPARETGGGLLTEIDRTYLKDAVPDIEFAPSPVELMYRQKLYLYMMLTKPTETLTVSYARQSSAEPSGRPSYLFAHLLKLFPSCAETFPETDELKTQAETKADMEKRLTHEIARFASGNLTEKEETFFLSAFDLLPEKDAHLIGDAAFYRYTEDLLDKDLPALLYGAQTSGTVSRLELFASCAYAHFLTYGLHLKEPVTYDFNAMDLGNVYHGVLELFAERLSDEGESWTSFLDSDAEAYLEDAIYAYTASYGGARLYDNARTRQQITRMKRILFRTVKTLRYQLQKGLFTPAYAEELFEKNITKEGIDLRLHGRIDRIDLCETDDATFVKIIDFKSGKRDFDISSMYYGLQLQLVLYMDAALSAEEKKTPAKDVIPAAMLYYRVTDPVVNEQDMKEGTGDEAEQMQNRKLRMTGLVNANETVISLLDRSMMTTSDVIPVGYTTAGDLTAASSCMTTKDYDTIRAHAETLITQMGERIMRGEKTVSPYETKDRDACTYCAYHSVCGFDPHIAGFHTRVLKKMTQEEAIAAMRGDGYPGGTDEEVNATDEVISATDEEVTITGGEA